MSTDIVGVTSSWKDSSSPISSSVFTETSPFQHHHLHHQLTSTDQRIISHLNQENVESHNHHFQTQNHHYQHHHHLHHHGVASTASSNNSNSSESIASNDAIYNDEEEDDDDNEENLTIFNSFYNQNNFDDQQNDQNSSITLNNNFNNFSSNNNDNNNNNDNQQQELGKQQQQNQINNLFKESEDLEKYQKKHSRIIDDILHDFNSVSSHADDIVLKTDITKEETGEHPPTSNDKNNLNISSVELNGIGDNQHLPVLQSRSPTTSVSSVSLPPLPDLIPIKKSLQNNNCKSIMAPLTNRKSKKKKQAEAVLKKTDIDKVGTGIDDKLKIPENIPENNDICNTISSYNNNKHNNNFNNNNKLNINNDNNSSFNSDDMNDKNNSINKTKSSNRKSSQNTKNRKNVNNSKNKNIPKDNEHILNYEQQLIKINSQNFKQPLHSELSSSTSLKIKKNDVNKTRTSNKNIDVINSLQHQNSEESDEVKSTCTIDSNKENTLNSLFNTSILPSTNLCDKSSSSNLKVDNQSSISSTPIDATTETNNNIEARTFETNIKPVDNSTKVGPKKRGRKPKDKTEITTDNILASEEYDPLGLQPRKSARKRVARDIFFLFEEYPVDVRRRTTRNSNNKRPRGRPKSKFSYLTVEDNASILRHEDNKKGKSKQNKIVPQPKSVTFADTKVPRVECANNCETPKKQKKNQAEKTKKAKTDTLNNKKVDKKLIKTKANIQPSSNDNIQTHYQKSNDIDEGNKKSDPLYALFNKVVTNRNSGTINNEVSQLNEAFTKFGKNIEHIEESNTLTNSRKETENHNNDSLSDINSENQNSIISSHGFHTETESIDEIIEEPTNEVKYRLKSPVPDTNCSKLHDDEILDQQVRCREKSPVIPIVQEEIILPKIPKIKITATPIHKVSYSSLSFDDPPKIPKLTISATPKHKPYYSSFSFDESSKKTAATPVHKFYTSSLSFDDSKSKAAATPRHQPCYAPLLFDDPNPITSTPKHKPGSMEQPAIPKLRIVATPKYVPNYPPLSFDETPKVPKLTISATPKHKTTYTAICIDNEPPKIPKLTISATPKHKPYYASFTFEEPNTRIAATPKHKTSYSSLSFDNELKFSGASTPRYKPCYAPLVCDEPKVPKLTISATPKHKVSFASISFEEPKVPKLTISSTPKHKTSYSSLSFDEPKVPKLTISATPKHKPNYGPFNSLEEPKSKIAETANQTSVYEPTELDEPTTTPILAGPCATPRHKPCYAPPSPPPFPPLTTQQNESPYIAVQEEIIEDKNEPPAQATSKQPLPGTHFNENTLINDSISDMRKHKEYYDLKPVTRSQRNPSPEKIDCHDSGFSNEPQPKEVCTPKENISKQKPVRQKGSLQTKESSKKISNVKTTKKTVPTKNNERSNKVNSKNKVKAVEENPLSKLNSIPTRVNPIFLWVKQDDTRIVEVRCEDYDKRNRIKLTKTSNGSWRAIPRTDPTSAKLAKAIPSIRIKQEIYHSQKEVEDQLECNNSQALEENTNNNNESVNDVQPDSKKQLKKLLLTMNIKQNKKKKKKKKKKHKQKIQKETTEKEPETPSVPERIVSPIPIVDPVSIVPSTVVQEHSVMATTEDLTVELPTENPPQASINIEDKPEEITELCKSTESIPQLAIEVEEDEGRPPPTPPPFMSPSNTDVIVYESTNHDRNDEVEEASPVCQNTNNNNDENNTVTIDISQEDQDQPQQLNITPINSFINSSAIISNSPAMISNSSAIISNSSAIISNSPAINENEITADLTKNLTELSDDDIELQIPQFMVHHPDKDFGRQLMNLCQNNNVFENVNSHNSTTSNNLSTNAQVQAIHPQSSHIVTAVPNISTMTPPIFSNSNSNNNNNTNISSNNDHQVTLSDSFDPTDVDTKHLKDLLDDADLLQNCDNAMTGNEIIDSLVKRRCEDNHISLDDEPSGHNDRQEKGINQDLANATTICLDDFENENESILMRQEPVDDIICRLNDTLAPSPKCLSFNEAGEIEGLHGELFQTNTNSDPFNRATLEELSITIKDLEKTSQPYINEQPNKSKSNVTSERNKNTVSPDSCADDIPKDLTCKKPEDDVQIVEASKKSSPIIENQVERPNSRSSDAIQSPQPSGLPAVPPSPDLIHTKTKNLFLDQILNPATSSSPKLCSSLTVTPIKVPSSTTITQVQQKEPLDLGKHRKSASPTVTCSEEAKRSHNNNNNKINSTAAAASSTSNTIAPNLEIIDVDALHPEPPAKRLKHEQENLAQSVSTNSNNNNINSNNCNKKSYTENLMDMLSTGKDPDPLTQLRLLISNPEWKVPDPILVPKDRLNAILASPAREIPLLLTTRKELRLPEAFAYPSILQDPDILVISMAQLEAILQKQVEIPRPKPTPPVMVTPQVTIEAVPNPNANNKNIQRAEKPTPQLHTGPTSDMQSQINEENPISPPTEPSSKKTTVNANSNNAAVNANFAAAAAAKNLLNNPLAPLLASAGLASEIDAATMAAFNQMLWLPYLGQMAPDLFKAMSNLQNNNNTTNNNNTNNLAELLPLLQAQQQAAVAAAAQQSVQTNTNQFNPLTAVAAAAALQNPMAAAAALQNPMAAAAAFQNPLEMAMWQQVLTQAQMQRILKLQQEQQKQQQQQAAAVLREQELKKKQEDKLNAQRNLAALFAAQKEAENKKLLNEIQQKSQMQQSQNQKQRSMIGINPFRQEHNRNTQRLSTSASNSNADKSNSTRPINPFHQNYTPGGVDITPVLRSNKSQQKSNLNHSNQIDQKPRLTCKSLTNLLQPDRVLNPAAAADNKMANLMAMPGFDFNFSGATNPFQSQHNFNSNNNMNSNSNNIVNNQAHNYHQSHFNSSSSSSGASSSLGALTNQLNQRSNSNNNNNNNNNSSNHQQQQLHHQQQLQHHHQQQQQQQQQHNQSAKLKVKSGSHLLDPVAMQRRLLNCSNNGDDSATEVGSTTSSLDDIMMSDPNAALWHPLFGSAQKNTAASAAAAAAAAASAYSSPWQWTTVTATGE